MARQGKRYRADLEGWDREQPLALDEAVKRLKNFKKTKFDQSVEVCMSLGIDAKQADQLVRGSVSLPHGIGVSRRVIAFCQPDKVEDAKAAGAAEAGGEELVVDSGREGDLEPPADAHDRADLPTAVIS